MFDDQDSPLTRSDLPDILRSFFAMSNYMGRKSQELAAQKQLAKKQAFIEQERTEDFFTPELNFNKYGMGPMTRRGRAVYGEPSLISQMDRDFHSGGILAGSRSLGLADPRWRF